MYEAEVRGASIVDISTMDCLDESHVTVLRWLLWIIRLYLHGLDGIHVPNRLLILPSVQGRRNDHSRVRQLQFVGMPEGNYTMADATLS
jgi:hypothetical protein